MGSENPFQVTVYDKAFGKRGTLFCSSIAVSPRHNQQPTAQLTVPGYVPLGEDGTRIPNPRLGDLLTKGARVWTRFRGDHLLSGTVTDWEQSGPSTAPTFTVQVADDWAVLARLLAWPKPTSALTTQDVEYDVRTGPAETVLKAIVTANKGRITPAVRVAPDQGRGATITVQNRFHALTERVVPLLDDAGIGVTVRQAAPGEAGAPGLVLDVYETRDYPRTLTEASGVVRDPRVAWHAPKANRVVVGGPGDGTARLFTQVDATGDDAASTLGYTAEAFYDATDTDANRTTGETQRSFRGAQFLADNATTGGLRVTLAQTAIFAYDPTGTDGVRVGDRVPIQLLQGVVASDLLRSCSLTWTNDAGLTVTPQIGDVDSGDRALLTVVSKLRTAVMQLTRR